MLSYKPQSESVFPFFHFIFIKALEGVLRETSLSRSWSKSRESLEVRMRKFTFRLEKRVACGVLQVETDEESL